MNRFLVVSAFFFATLLVGPAHAQNATITIDRIDSNKAISGRVHGLAAADVGKVKVIVYVQTDRWYIHPYAGQGEGNSWAVVAPSGGWKLPTVKRDFPATSVSALLVERGFPEPATLQSLANIPSITSVTRVLRGTPDFGKL